MSGDVLLPGTGTVLRQEFHYALHLVSRLSDQEVARVVGLVLERVSPDELDALDDEIARIRKVRGDKPRG